MPGTRITDQQVSLYMNIRKNKSQALAAAKTGISERSARRIESADALPSQNPRRYWRSRVDPFTQVWDSDVVPLLRGAPTLMGITVLRQAPGRSPRSFPRRDAAYLAATHSPLARHGRAAQGGVLPPDLCARSPGSVGLHLHGRAAGERCARAVCPHPVPLCSGLLQMGTCGSG